MRARWITFDCYGTLVNWQAGLRDVLAPLAGDKAPDIVRAYATCQLAVEREQPRRPHKQVLATALVRAAAVLGVGLSESDARAIAGSWATLRPFADVETMLAELRRRGYRLGVLTNVDDDMFEITHRSFAAPFNLFVTAERVRGFKPEPWLFRAFERMTGVGRNEWVHVASNWEHDIAPAQALGVPQVWLDRERSGSAPDVARVTSAPEAVRAIDALMAR
jgi:2-haloacid dehalogenase